MGREGHGVGKGRRVDPGRIAVSWGALRGLEKGLDGEVREEPWVKTTLGWVQEGRLGKLEAPHVGAIAPPDILGVWRRDRGSRQAVEVAVVCPGAGLCSPRAVPGGASHLPVPAGCLLPWLQLQEQGLPAAWCLSFPPVLLPASLEEV